MKRVQTILWTLFLVLVAVSTSLPQTDGTLKSAPGPANTAPVSDHGFENPAPESVADSPQAATSSDPLPEARSLFLVGLYASETAEANFGDHQPNGSQLFSLTRVLSSLSLLKIKRRSETTLDYRAGGWFEHVGSSGFTNYPLQQMQVSQRFVGQKTALTLADSLGNFPGGTLGAAWFGGASAYNLGTTSVVANPPADPGIADFIGSSSFGGFGREHLTNVGLTEITRSLTPRSSLTVAGAYGLTTYLGNIPGFIDNRQVSAFANYGYTISERSEIGLVYGFRNFQFPGSGAGGISSHVAQLAYIRALSRRLRLQAGVGPEFSRIQTSFVLGDSTTVVRANLATRQLNLSAYGSLAYRLRSGTVQLSYDRLVTNGSGLFAGANANIVQFSSGRAWRSWETSLNLGYVRLSRIQQEASLVPGSSYQYGFAGVGVRRRFGPFYGVASYQFNDESVDTSSCQSSHTCGSLAQRHVALVGIYWHSRPFHLDSGSSSQAETTGGVNAGASADAPNAASSDH